MIPLDSHPDTDASTFPLTVAALRQAMPLAEQKDLVDLASSMSATDRAAAQQDVLYRFGRQDPDFSDQIKSSRSTGVKIVAGLAAAAVAGVAVPALGSNVDYDGHLLLRCTPWGV